MKRALGYCQQTFDPFAPGRLCRGRERWIEPYENPGEPVEVERLVITGATFTDDSARDALRGITHSEVDLAAIIAALFPRRRMLAFMEDGHASEIPEEAEAVEAYPGYRAGGRSQVVMVRWRLQLSGVRELRATIGPAPQQELVRGFAVLRGEEAPEELEEPLFGLVGMSTLDSPPARYNPALLPDVLEHVRAVILLHRDKHGPALGIYSHHRVKAAERLPAVCERYGAMLVPFAIPPMLARWDRALYELREVWDEAERGPFPVPESDDPSSWHRRQKRRRRRRKKRRQKSGEE